MNGLMEKIKDNQKVFMALGIGVVAIISAILVIKPFGGGVSEDVIPNSEQSYRAVYAVVDIPSNTVITEEMVDVKELSEDEEQGDYEYSGDVIGAKSLATIEKGSLMKQEQIDNQKSQNMPEEQLSSGLSSNIPEGLRAIVMPAGPAQDMVEYLEIGDKIDLLVSHTKEDGLETITPFQNIEVLSIGDGASDYPVPAPAPTVGEDGEEIPPVAEPYPTVGSGGSTVVLAMTPEQTEVLANMKVSGVLQTADITLRNSDDDEIKTLDQYGESNFEDWRNR